MIRFTQRSFAILVLCFALLAATVTVPAMAQLEPGISACKGRGYKEVRSTDGTLFKNPGECIRHVKDDGTLIAVPGMVIDVYYRAEYHCEFAVDLYGMTPGTSVPVSFVDPETGARTLDSLIGTDGTTSNSTGGYGVAFPMSRGYTVTVTASFVDIGGPAVLTQAVEC
jgi:hypothetical protein